MRKTKVYSIVMNNFKNDSRVLKESLSLLKYKYDVKVLALADEKEELPEYDNVSGVPVHRIKLSTKKWSKNIIIQIFKYVEYIFKVVYECRKVNIIHCNDLEPLPIAVIIKLLSFGKVKIVYDAHELETERYWLKGIYKFGSKIMERLFIKFVDDVITVSEGIADEYVRLYNIKRPNIVLNCPVTQKINKTNVFRETFNISNEKTIFLYQGGLNVGRGVEILIETFNKINREDIVLIFMGYGPLVDLVKESAQVNNRIKYHEAVSPDKILQYTASADIGVAFIENRCLSYYYCLPNKLFEYAMASLPVLVNNLPELAKIISKYNCGAIVAEETVASITKEINRIMEMNLLEMSINSRRMAEKYCWEEQEKILLDVYRRLN